MNGDERVFLPEIIPKYCKPLFAECSAKEILIYVDLQLPTSLHTPPESESVGTRVGSFEEMVENPVAVRILDEMYLPSAVPSGNTPFEELEEKLQTIKEHLLIVLDGTFQNTDKTFADNFSRMIAKIASPKVKVLTTSCSELHLKEETLPDGFGINDAKDVLITLEKKYYIVLEFISFLRTFTEMDIKKRASDIVENLVEGKNPKFLKEYEGNIEERLKMFENDLHRILMILESQSLIHYYDGGDAYIVSDFIRMCAMEYAPLNPIDEIRLGTVCATFKGMIFEPPNVEGDVEAKQKVRKDYKKSKVDVEYAVQMCNKKSFIPQHNLTDDELVKAVKYIGIANIPVLLLNLNALLYHKNYTRIEEMLSNIKRVVTEENNFTPEECSAIKECVSNVDQEE